MRKIREGFVAEYGLVMKCPHCGKGMEMSLHEDDFIHYEHPKDSECRIRTIIVYAGE